MFFKTRPLLHHQHHHPQFSFRFRYSYYYSFPQQPKLASSSLSTTISSSALLFSSIRICSSSNENSSSFKTVEQLQLKIKQLEEQVQIRDNIIRECMSNNLLATRGSTSGSSSSSSFNTNPHNPDCGRFVVDSGVAFADAITNGGANHILLDRNAIAANFCGSEEVPCIYLPCSLSLEGDHIVLVETVDSFLWKNGFQDDGSNPADATKRVKIVGTWKLSERVKLHAHDIDFCGDDHHRFESLFFLSSSASLALHSCDLGRAREAVYLSSSTSATLTRCKIHNNSRGIFESYRSNCKLIGCEFEDNIFHAVLLSGIATNKTIINLQQQRKNAPSSSSSLNQLQQYSSKENGGRSQQRTRLDNLQSLGNIFEYSDRVRGDVCFSYNPMLDYYDEVYLKDAKSVLTDSQATTGLADSSW